MQVTVDEMQAIGGELRLSIYSHATELYKAFVSADEAWVAVGQLYYSGYIDGVRAEREKRRRKSKGD